MIASGVFEFRSANEDEVWVRIAPSFKDRFIPLIKKKDDCEYDVEMSMRCTIVQTQLGGVIQLLRQDQPILLIKEHRPLRTMAQNATLRGIERFISWATTGEKPTDEEIDMVHEAVIEQVMPEVTNTYNGKTYHKRTSEATTVEMSRCIEKALNWLATTDVPDALVISLGKGMKEIWTQWYKWRYTQDEDPLFQDELEMTWDKYRESHTVCELCALAEEQGDPLERMHIVSGGSNIAAYEYSWNWLHAHRSHHSLQHSVGWAPIESEFPHIVGKLNKARELAEGMRK